MRSLSIPLILAAGALLVIPKNSWSGENTVAQENSFFAFKNSMESGTPIPIDKQARIIYDIGFDGFDNRDLENLATNLHALHRFKLKMYTVYFTVNIDPGAVPYNPELSKLLPLLKSHGTVLWCNTHSKRFQPSDPTGDEFAVPVFREIADLATKHGVKVAPYPHTGLWVESPEDTARLADKVDRRNFGTSFNLYHWNALGEKKQPLEDVVKRIAPRMFVMSINGDVGPHNIGPLEESKIDSYYTALKAFRDAGYRGPVGLQCYKIPGEPETHLSQSFNVWTKLEDRFMRDSKTP